MKNNLYHVEYYYSLNEKKLPAIRVTYFVYAKSPCLAVQKVLSVIVPLYPNDVIYHIHSDVEPVSNFLK